MEKIIMPKLDITPDEKTHILDALQQALASAKRQQNMKGRTATIRSVYEAHQRVLEQLEHKIADAK